LIGGILRFLRGIESSLLVGMLAVMIAMAAYQVIARNFYDSGIIWGDSLVRVLVLWITLLGAMVASRNDEHIRMDLVSHFMTDIGQRLLRRAGSLFTCVICGIFTWYSLELVMLDFEDEIVAFAKVPAWACEAIMPLGGGVIALRYLLHTISPPETQSQ
jgi:TRAP-type C4-dicarboxylate transport system permease small subunit